ncbi:DUF2756 domain-containing protein [Escherichia coli]|uniref:DUF2756 domain-containing protein n=1 Tax=Escherichia coli TaxID=562 RepID=UPI003AF2F397
MQTQMPPQTQQIHANRDAESATVKTQTQLQQQHLESLITSINQYFSAGVARHSRRER